MGTWGVLDRVRPAAVAGRFYPGAPDALAAAINRLLGDAPPGAATAPPKAIVVPHAGYIYSGPIAAAGFARVAARPIERVVIVGPAHRVFCDRLVWPGAACMATPLGDVAVDVAAIERAGIAAHPEAHAREHSIEVELPFVQRLWPHARVVPLIVSRTDPAAVADVLVALWGGPETLVAISSDLSHYLPYAEGRARDRATADKIVAHAGGLRGDEACGAAALDGLARIARDRGLRAELVDLRSSGDTAGPRDEVVGYGAFAYYEAA